MTDERIERILGSLLRAGVISAAGVVIVGGALSEPDIIRFGLLLLVGTPVVRVVFSVIAFALERDWLYVWITLIVLAVLAYGLAAAS
jgi:uncharacterized membrane protein